jgi:hypothetical protein
MDRMGQLQVTVKRWRTWSLTILVVAILVATVPAAIRRILQTGDLYLFTRQFFDDMLARLSGAGRFRFVLQPIIALLLGSRDGQKDARKGVPPYLWALAFHAEHRRELLRGTFASLREIVAVAILLDILSQFLIFHEIHPGAAIILGPVLIGMPYAMARAIAGRITKKKVSDRHPST